MSSDRVTVATDGSCLGNPGPGGWAWATGEGEWGAGANSRTTNNLMELRALYEALRAFPPEVPLLIQADSQYVIRIFTEWVDGWIARGWRTADKKPVGNRPNIELIVPLLHERDVEWEHVRGHTGHNLNELVDKRARAAATAIRDGLPVDSGPGRRVPHDDH